MLQVSGWNARARWISRSMNSTNWCKLRLKWAISKTNHCSNKIIWIKIVHFTNKSALIDTIKEIVLTFVCLVRSMAATKKGIVRLNEFIYTNYLAIIPLLLGVDIAYLLQPHWSEPIDRHTAFLEFLRSSNVNRNKKISNFIAFCPKNVNYYLISYFDCEKFEKMSYIGPIFRSPQWFNTY